MHFLALITLKDMKPHPYFSHNKYSVELISSYQNLELQLVRIRHVPLTVCLLTLFLSCRVGQGGSPQQDNTSPWEGVELEAAIGPPGEQVEKH